MKSSTRTREIGSEMRRLIVATLLTVGLTAITIPANATSAPDCYGGSCEGKDPSTTNCVDDAITIMRYGARDEGGAYGTVELRYSPKCHSNWNRFNTDTGIRALLQIGMKVAVSHAQPWIWRPGTTPRGTANQAFGVIGSSYWTEMITADGTTCTSVDVYTQGTLPSDNKFSPGTDQLKHGPFNAPCVS